MVSIDRLHEVLRLTEAGKLFWRVTLSNRAVAGSETGTTNSNGYRVIGIDGTQFYVHRVVFAMANNRWTDREIDHVNGVKTDNRSENLREATRSQNGCNTSIGPTNKSGVKGVSWHKLRMKWRAKIQINGRSVYLGEHEDIDLAELVVTEARLRLHGEFARIE